MTKKKYAYSHFYRTVQEGDTTQKVPAITRCVIWQDGEPVAVGYSFCSPKDNFGRKSGRIRAKARADHALASHASFGMLKGEGVKKVVFSVREDLFERKTVDVYLESILKYGQFYVGLFLKGNIILPKLEEWQKKLHQQPKHPSADPWIWAFLTSGAGTKEPLTKEELEALRKTGSECLR